MRRRQVLVVEDHPLVGDCLTQLINKQPDLRVCAVAPTMTDARRLAARLCPDIAVVDLSLRDGLGLELIRQLRAQRSAPEVVVLTMHEDASLARRALRAGARGYVTKSDPTTTILVAIRAALAGNVYVSEPLTSRLLDPAADKPLATLSDRELAVFELVGQGLRTRAIAQRLNLSVKTVETYRARIKRKLGLTDGAALTRQAVLWQSSPSARGD